MFCVYVKLTFMWVLHATGLLCLKGRGGSIVGRVSQGAVSAKGSTSEVQLTLLIGMVGAFPCRHGSYISHIKEAHGVYFGEVMHIGYCKYASGVIVFLKVLCMKMHLELSVAKKTERSTTFQEDQNAHFQYNST